MDIHLKSLQKQEQNFSNNTDKGLFDIQSFLPYRLFRLTNLMEKCGNKHSLTSFDDRFEQIRDREKRVISVLGCYGALTNAAIADVLRIDAPTVSRAVKVLKHADLLDTNISAGDRRKSLIFLTSLGSVFFESIIPEKIKNSSEFQSCFSPDEKKQLARLLDKLEKHLALLEISEGKKWELDNMEISISEWQSG